MTLEHFELLPVFEANNIIVMNRFVDRNRGLRRRGWRDRGPDGRQSGINLLDELGQVFGRDRVVGDVGRDDVRGQRQQVGSRVAIIHLHGPATISLTASRKE